MTAPTTTAARLARPAAAVLAAALLGWLGVRGAAAFDQGRRADAAREVVTAPDVVTHTLPRAPGTVPAGIGGRLQYRPGEWLSVVTLRGLAPTAGRERYLVFLHNWSGWSLAGATGAGADGAAQVRFGAEPKPSGIFEVLVTRGVDDATSVPHGTPLLHWFDAANAPPRAVPFDFTTR